MTRIEADAVFSGSGTLLDALAGAGEALEARYRFVRWAGTSGGSLVAAGRAFGYSWIELQYLRVRPLNNMLDPSLRPWERWGFVAGDKIHNVLRSIFRNQRMGAARDPWCCYATDPWSGDVVQLSSWGTPDVLAADAVRASIAIPFFFKGVYLKLPGESTPRFLVDGGIGANLAMDAFDDKPARPTIGIALATGTKARKPVEVAALDLLRPRIVVDKSLRYVAAILDVMMDSGVKAHESSKHTAQTVLIDAHDESGMDFWLSSTDVEKRWAMGAASAGRFLASTRE